MQALRFIAQWVREHAGESPSLKEIAAGLGLSSLASAHGLVDALQTRGMVTRLYGMSRSLEVTEKGRVAFQHIEAKNYMAVMQLAAYREG
jgi:SOS-response transcriptional repressor LexA